MNWLLLEAEHLLCLETGAAITLTSESTSGPWFIEHHVEGHSRELSGAFDDHDYAVLVFLRVCNHLGFTRMRYFLHAPPRPIEETK